MTDSEKPRRQETWPTIAGLVRVGDVVGHFLGELIREAEENSRRHGPLRGPVRPPQRRWSQVLDSLEHERQCLESTI